MNTELSTIVGAAIESQSWYRKYANTINAAVLLALNVGAVLTTSGLDLPGWVPAVIGVIGSVATILGIHRTQNGLPEDTLARLLGQQPKAFVNGVYTPGAHRESR